MSWLRLGALVVVAVLGLAVASHRRNDARPAHERAALGECASCHDDAPRHHDNARWELMHGRVQDELAARCGTCHAASTCTSCHQRRPASHTAAFAAPALGGPHAALHGALGRADAAACVVCHRTPASECAGCHRAGEARIWMDEAAPKLARWNALLNPHEPTHTQPAEVHRGDGSE